MVNRLTLLLDTDEGVLRFGLNGVLMERAVEKIPAGVCFAVSGCHAAFEIVTLIFLSVPNTFM